MFPLKFDLPQSQWTLWMNINKMKLSIASLSGQNQTARQSWEMTMMNKNSRYHPEHWIFIDTSLKFYNKTAHDKNNTPCSEHKINYTIFHISINENYKLLDSRFQIPDSRFHIPDSRFPKMVAVYYLHPSDSQWCGVRSSDDTPHLWSL